VVATRAAWAPSGGPEATHPHQPLCIRKEPEKPHGRATRGRDVDPGGDHPLGMGRQRVASARRGRGSRTRGTSSRCRRGRRPRAGVPVREVDADLMSSPGLGVSVSRPRRNRQACGSRLKASPGTTFMQPAVAGIPPEGSVHHSRGGHGMPPHERAVRLRDLPFLKGQRERPVGGGIPRQEHDAAGRLVEAVHEAETLLGPRPQAAGASRQPSEPGREDVAGETPGGLPGQDVVVLEEASAPFTLCRWPRPQIPPSYTNGSQPTNRFPRARGFRGPDAGKAQRARPRAIPWQTTSSRRSSRPQPRRPGRNQLAVRIEDAKRSPHPGRNREGRRKETRSTACRPRSSSPSRRSERTGTSRLLRTSPSESRAGS
jgi:hypothetical protein